MSDYKEYRRKASTVKAAVMPHAGESPAGVEYDGGKPFVVTAHKQRVYVEPGDMIVPEPDGSGHYPVKPDIFHASHDPVDAPAVGDVVFLKSGGPPMTVSHVAGEKAPSKRLDQSSWERIPEGYVVCVWFGGWESATALLRVELLTRKNPHGKRLPNRSAVDVGGVGT